MHCLGKHSQFEGDKLVGGMKKIGDDQIVDCQEPTSLEPPSPPPSPPPPPPLPPLSSPLPSSPDLSPEIVFPNDDLVEQALANCPQGCLVIIAKDEEQELESNAGKGGFGLIVQGTDGCDCIIGTEGPDVIYGYGGGKHRRI